MLLLQFCDGIEVDEELCPPPPLACLWKYMGFEEERCLVARR